MPSGKDAAPPSSTPASGSLTLPGKNHELKRQEEETLFGKDLLLKMKLPNGDVIDMKVKESNEVGYVKLLLAEKCAVQPNRLVLRFNGQQLIDPMSLCDHQGVRPPGIDVDVQFL